jgi:hypothetical protein
MKVNGLGSKPWIVLSGLLLSPKCLESRLPRPSAIKPTGYRRKILCSDPPISQKQKHRRQRRSAVRARPLFHCRIALPRERLPVLQGKCHSTQLQKTQILRAVDVV